MVGFSIIGCEVGGDGMGSFHGWLTPLSQVLGRAAGALRAVPPAHDDTDYDHDFNKQP